MKVKSRIPDDKRKGVVFEIPCSHYDHVYVGETTRTLKRRISEHKQVVKNFNQINGVAVHAHRHNHNITSANSGTPFSLLDPAIIIFLSIYPFFAFMSICFRS